MRRKKTNAPGLVRGLLLVALCASGVVGCSREEEAAKDDAPPPYVPESYMNDPEFRGEMKARRQARQKLVNERTAVLEKMQEIERANGGDAAKFEKDAAWQAHKAQLAELDAQYEKARREQLQYVRERLAPKKDNR